MRDVRKSEVEGTTYVNYLSRAQQCHALAQQALICGSFDACAINSVHCGISAVDAVCVRMLKCRHAGERHEDVVTLIKSIRQISGVDQDYIAKRLLKLLKMKNMAEYEERPVKHGEAAALFRHADDLLKKAVVIIENVN